MTLSPDQQAAHDAVIAFFRSGRALLTMGGLAGSGKTTVIAQIVKTLWAQPKKPSIAFCCFTGKASNVLREKLNRAGIATSDGRSGPYCGTIHRLIYTPVIKDRIIIGWDKVPELAQDLIIIDEASMVNEKLFQDLTSYGKPILAVGDHGQLPPVGGSLNLMEDPEIRLEKIHRQAEGNPIIKLSMMARQDGKIPIGEYGPWVKKVRGSWQNGLLDRITDPASVMFLCGFNKTRVGLNAEIRRRLGRSGPPMATDRVICLKNKAEMGLFNGMLGTIKAIAPARPEWYQAQIDMEGSEPFEGLVLKAQFGQEKTIQDVNRPKRTAADAMLELPDPVWGLFDFGYALTCHKSQGSEAQRVVVFEERFPMATDEDWRRWLYTACTRSSEKLLVVER